MLRTAGLASIFSLAMIGFTPAQENPQEDAARQPAAAGKVTATGILKIEIALKASSALPNGTSISVNAGASYFDPKYSNSSYVYPPASVVAAGKVSTTVSIPYKWILSDRKGKLYVSVNVSGFGKNEVYDTTSLNKKLAIPANGTVTTVHVTGTI